ncbi:MAG: SMC family ATPase [Candidatus Babeliales bacterium]
MIPRKLELRNFLSYPDQGQEIDFSEYSLICLSGKNGNGKSALLDAITWAVWGQARKISGTVKPDLGLLRLGQTQMVVSFEFEFNNSVYKVRREFSKTYGKPYVALDLSVFDQQKDKFISLSEKTIKTTQDKIEKLLGLDFDTFVNSAFLRQGLANEFSQKSPKDRKQILSNILGFSFYDNLQQQASENAKKLLDEKKILIKIKEQADLELQKEDIIKKDQETENLLITKINEEVFNLIQNLENKELSKNNFLKQKHEYTSLLTQISTLDKNYKIKLNNLSNLIISWKNVHYKSLNLSNIENLEQEKIILQNQDKEFLLLQQKSLALQEDILYNKELYQKEFNNLKVNLEKKLQEFNFGVRQKELEFKQILNLLCEKEQNKAQLEKKNLQFNQELQDINKNLKEQKKFEQEFTFIQKRFEKRRAFYSILIQKGNWLKSQLKELEKKQDFVCTQTSPSCPLCEQMLSAKRKQFLAVKFSKDYQFVTHRINRITVLIEKLKNILLIGHEEYQSFVKKSDFYKDLILKKDNLEKNINILELDLHEIIKIIQDLKNQQETLTKTLLLENKVLQNQQKQLNIVLQEDKKIQELSLCIKELEQKQKNLNYDKNAHNKLKENLNLLEKKLQDLDFLKKELETQKDKKEKIKNFIIELKELKKELLDFFNKIKNLKFDLSLETKIEQEIKNIKIDINLKTKEKEVILQKLGNIENELKRLEKLKKENIEFDKKIELLEVESQDYQILAQAFGKNGIQALLIEEAIPQIEEEANNILSKLTDNQAQIFIESLRDLKNGGVKETLDIQISDLAGIRPYEMFSGGEAFRVDFALRIAISKLLARRAGTALQTLIIDEGFGSQDEEGLNRLMDAIYAIKKDFSKIIVVSHLTDFKNNFPHHFVVEKGPSGSIVRVEHRG